MNLAERNIDKISDLFEPQGRKIVRFWVSIN